MKYLRLTSFLLSDACNEVQSNLGWLQSGLPVISISGNFWSNMSNAGHSSRVNLGLMIDDCLFVAARFDEIKQRFSEMHFVAQATSTV